MNGFVSLSASAWDWSNRWLALAIDAGICAGLIAFVVLLLNALCRRWLSSRQMGLLWGLVLLRLLVPFAPSSSLSLQNLLMSNENMSRERIAVVGQSSESPYSVPNFQRRLARANPDFERSSAPMAATFETELAVAVELLFEILPLIWLAGGALYLIWVTIAHWRFCRRLRQIASCDDARLCRLWTECCQQVAVHRHIPIVLFDGVQQPAILGLLRPKLLLPLHISDLDDQQLRMVMFHELAHVRRGDIAVNWALVVVRAVHWWNPVYWLAATRLQSLREQSCDAFAIQRLEGSPIRGYSELLLTLSQREQSGPRWRIMLPASMLGFLSSFFRRHSVRNRLKALQSAGVVRGRWQIAVVAGLIALLAFCGFTDARPHETQTDRTWDFLSSSARGAGSSSALGADWLGLPKMDVGPKVPRTYDIEKALQRIAADHRTKEDARVEMYWALVLLLRQYTGQYQKTTNESAQEQFTLTDTTLTVDAPLEMHTEIARHIAAWEQSGLVQISVHVQFITDEHDIASEVGVSWQYVEAFAADRDDRISLEPQSGTPVIQATASVEDYLAIAVSTLTAQQASQFIETAQTAAHATVLDAPKVTVINGQQATVVDCSYRPFVVGVHATSAGVQQPKRVVIEEGTRLAFRPVHSSDGDKTLLETQVTLTQIGNVHEVSTLLRGKKTAIQLPRVNRCRIDVSSEVPDGQTLLVGCMPTHEHKRYLYMLFTVRSIDGNLLR